jgi:MFS family permease
MCEHDEMPATPAAELGRGRRLTAVAVCTLATFLVNVDNTSYQVALPSIRADVGATFAQGQWILSTYGLTAASVVLVAGALGDRFDKRKVLVFGLLGYILGTALTGLAPTAPLLIAARVLTGLGGATLVPLGLAMVRALATSAAQMGRFTGAWGVAVGLGMAAGPLIGGALSSLGNWRLLPLASLSFAAVFAILALIVLPRSVSGNPVRPDWLGVALMAAASVGIVGALTEAGEVQWPLAGGLFALFVLAGLALVLRYRFRGRSPIPPEAFRSRQFRYAMGAAVANYACVGGTLLLLTHRFQSDFGMSPFRAGVALVPLAIAYAVCSQLANVAIDRRGPFFAIAAAGFATIAGSCAVVVFSGSLGWAVAAGVVLGGAAGLANTPVNIVAMSELPPRHSGFAGSATSSARQMGQAGGIAACGALLALAATPLLSSDSAPSYLADLVSQRLSWLPLIAAGALLAYVGLAGRPKAPKLTSVTAPASAAAAS